MPSIGVLRTLLKASLRRLLLAAPRSNRPGRRTSGKLSEQADPPDRRLRGRRRQRPVRARWSARRCRNILGQSIVIENKPGAGGRLAVEFVKNQPADGYTIMVAATGQMAIAAAIYPKLSYHPTRDFVPISMIASFPLILAGPANDTIKTVKDLVAYGKANPDKSNYATSSPAFTITVELFKLKTGMPAVGSALQEQQRDDAQRRRRQLAVLHRRRPAHHTAGARAARSARWR